MPIARAAGLGPGYGPARSARSGRPTARPPGGRPRRAQGEGRTAPACPGTARAGLAGRRRGRPVGLKSVCSPRTSAAVHAVPAGGHPLVGVDQPAPRKCRLTKPPVLHLEHRPRIGRQPATSGRHGHTARAGSVTAAASVGRRRARVGSGVAHGPLASTAAAPVVVGRRGGAGRRAVVIQLCADIVLRTSSGAARPSVR
jgi:hypothetical protein